MVVFMVIVFQGLIFLGLIFLLRQFMKGHVSGAMEHLQKLNDELMKQQADLKEKIAASQKEYETKTVKLQQEISTRQVQSKQEATKLLEESREKALQEREKLIGEAIETREKMHQEVMAEMDAKAVQYSREVIAEFFTGDLRRLVHLALVRNVIDGILEANLEQYQIDSDTAVLVSAEAMEADLKEEMRQVLTKKIHRDVQFKEETDAGLIGGLTLKFGTFVIDGSLTNRLQESAARLKRDSIRRFQGKT